jgi:hypothetical protein
MRHLAFVRATVVLYATLSACVGVYEEPARSDPSDDATPRDASDERDADVRDATDASPDEARTPDDVTRDRADAPTDVPPPPPPPPPPPEPDFESIAWSSPGYGVFYRDSENPRGNDVFIGYAGYGVQAPWGRSWVSRLYLDALRARGVRHVYAVQGPRDAGYDALEIGNSRLIAHMLPRLAPGARILVAAHSSGSFVAHELLGQLYAGSLDPTRLTAGRLSYWDLDGAAYGLTAAIVGQLRHAWFVWANDATTGTRSPNASTMIAAGGTYARAGGALALDVSGSGCNAGAAWCVHMTPIITRPHNPASGSVMLDYASFDETRRVSFAWLERTGFGAP